MRASELSDRLESSPVIARERIETRQEMPAVLSSGALAVSTNRKEIWYE